VDHAGGELESVLNRFAIVYENDCRLTDQNGVIETAETKNVSFSQPLLLLFKHNENQPPVIYTKL
jgi:hypothetical protein